MSELRAKITEALVSALPITAIVYLLALTPLITIQLLGFRSVVNRQMKERRAMRRMLSADDQQIISFM